MEHDSRIYIAGHRGLVGSAILRKLKSAGYGTLITRSRQEVDLRDQPGVSRFFEEEQPEYVFLAAAKVGGILANNTYPADFIYDNLAIQNNVIHQSYRHGVKKLLFLGSSCMYPKHAPQPMKEEHLLTGSLEPTNAPYAVAKIAGLTMCQSYNRQYGTNFISTIPTNLYGPGDSFDLETSHVLPALIRKFYEAKVKSESVVRLWGTGSPRREFLHVNDVADACLFLMLEHNGSEAINIGVGEDIAILELAEMIKEIVGYTGEIEWDTSKPDGTPQKLLDVSRIQRMGWTPHYGLFHGIKKTYEWVLENGFNT